MRAAPLAGWLVSRLVGWSVGRLVDRFRHLVAHVRACMHARAFRVTCVCLRARACVCVRFENLKSDVWRECPAAVGAGAVAKTKEREKVCAERGEKCYSAL